MNKNFLQNVRMCSKTIEAVFTKKDLNNEVNIYFLQNIPVDIESTYSNDFSIVQIIYEAPFFIYNMNQRWYISFTSPTLLIHFQFRKKISHTQLDLEVMNILQLVQTDLLSNLLFPLYRCWLYYLFFFSITFFFRQSLF